MTWELVGGSEESLLQGIAAEILGTRSERHRDCLLFWTDNTEPWGGGALCLLLQDDNLSNVRPIFWCCCKSLIVVSVEDKWQ